MAERALPGWPRGLGEEWAARYVGLSPSTFRVQVDAGEIAAAVQLTRGRKVWLREDLDAYLDRKAGRTVASQGSSWDNLTRGTREPPIPPRLPQPR